MFAESSFEMELPRVAYIPYTVSNSRIGKETLVAKNGH